MWGVVDFKCMGAVSFRLLFKINLIKLGFISVHIYSFIKPPLLSDVEMCCVTCVLLPWEQLFRNACHLRRDQWSYQHKHMTSDSTERGSPLLPTAAATPVPTTMLPHSPLLFAFLRQSRHVSSSPYIAAAFRHSRLPFCPPPDHHQLLVRLLFRHYWSLAVSIPANCVIAGLAATPAVALALAVHFPRVVYRPPPELRRYCIRKYGHRRC